MIRFECGCIAVEESYYEDPNFVLIVRQCDPHGHDTDGMGMFWRDMKGKSSEVITNEKRTEVIDELCRLIADGHNYRELMSRIAFGLKRTE